MSMKIFENPENEKGVWFPFALRVEEAHVRVEFFIRKVPAGKEDELTFRHYGRKMTLRFKRGEQLIDRDPEKLLAYAIDKGSFALLDSRGFPALEAGDPEAAAKFSEVLTRAVPVGEEIPLDGAWTPGLKRLVFNARRDVLGFVNKKADELAGAEADEEEDLGKT